VNGTAGRERATRSEVSQISGAPGAAPGTRCYPLTGGGPTLARLLGAKSLDPARKHRLDGFEDCTIVLPVPDTGAIQTARELCGARSGTLA
jgi:hypothetical protein